MWLIGLVAGLALGGVVGGGEGAVVGAVAGALLGAALAQLTKANAAETDKALREQVASLHAKVNWLYREFERQERELARLRGAPLAAPAADADQAPVPEPGAEPAPPAAGEPPPVAAKVDAPLVMAPADEIAAPAWWSRLLAGNPLAKVGVILLFFGVASALRLAAEYGLMPVSLRLFLAAAGGVGADRLRLRQGARRRTARLWPGGAGRRLRAALRGGLLHVGPLRHDRRRAGLFGFRRPRRRLCAAGGPAGRAGPGGTRHIRRLPRAGAGRRPRRDAAAAVLLLRLAQRLHPGRRLVPRLAGAQHRRLRVHPGGRHGLGDRRLPARALRASPRASWRCS